METHDRFDATLGVLCAIPGALMVGLTFVDVFARYLFAAPVRGSLEIIEFCMALVIFTALPLVTRHGEHVRVGLLEDLGPPWLRRARRLACDLVGAVVLSVVGWRLWVYADASLAAGTRTMVVGLPEAPLAYAMAVLSGVSAFVLFAAMAAALKGQKS
ncbi:TRAP transporter small permease [Ramlibacter tataouinensis]|uniref:TRAP transporter small permease n=1 Tax=Ramlibacter tataouinensis TaxID=94132 RepID=UPI0022F40419|nr:TRAP transporter small permease [Ramlibacter tataouinensis]WBY00251.1 TRAP transporter small permease [Ramlibacter tataouinensis]